MSVNGSNETQPKPLPEVLSKREQMKLDQAIKIIQSQENQQIKLPKRRANSQLPQAEQNPRKQIKIDAQINTPISEDIISSSSQSREPCSSTPPNPPQHSQQQTNHLNPLYELPEGQGGLFNYLLCYTYAQEEKLFEKQNQDWSRLDQLQGEKLVPLRNPNTTKIYRRLQAKFNQHKDRLKEPFGKNHREFGQKYFNKEFLME